MEAVTDSRPPSFEGLRFASSHRAFGRDMATLHLDFEPNGLLFDRSEGRLYIVDDTRARVLTLDSGATRLRLFACCDPVVPDGRLGHIARDRERNLWVPRYGHGTHGSLYRLDRNGRATEVERLDPGRRRIGLALGPDGFMYATSFRGCSHRGSGAVSRVLPGGGEVDVVAQLHKPVGLIGTEVGLVVADQAQNLVLELPLGRPTTWGALTSIPEPGPLAVGPSGMLFVGSRQGAIVAVHPSGRTRTVGIDLGDPRGLAFDPTGVLWVADRQKRPDAPPRTVLHAIRFSPRALPDFT